MGFVHGEMIWTILKFYDGDTKLLSDFSETIFNCEPDLDSL